MSTLGPNRARRITRACDRCHRSNLKCEEAYSAASCKACHDFGDVCTYTRAIGRRGPRPKPAAPAARMASPGASNHAWQYSAPVDHQTIESLVEGYKTIVYPIFPIFHWPSLIKDVRQLRYTSDRAFYIVIMVICAIVSDRLKHGLNTVDHTSPSDAPSESFHQLALDNFPRHLSEATDFNYKRSKALLTILCIQDGDVVNLMCHLGDYSTLSMIGGFSDEAKWPKSLKIPELEEWRRLYWSTYTLEIFSAVTWGGQVRHRHSQSNVQYPAEVYDDADITESYCNIPVDSSSTSFLHGWNVTTELYRVLEYLVDQNIARRCTMKWQNPAVSHLFEHCDPGLDTSAILRTVQGMYDSLDPIFKSVQMMSGIIEVDRFGFQAANLMVTLHTVKMLVEGPESSSIDRRCAVASQLLDALASIPVAYIAAISAPMASSLAYRYRRQLTNPKLHHLASIGHLLATAIKSPLTQWSLLQIRNVISTMANLISGLESVLLVKSDISLRLQTHVSTIDEMLNKEVREEQRIQTLSHTIPRGGDYTHAPWVEEHEPASQFTRPINTSDGDHLVEGLFEFSATDTLQLQNDLTMEWPFDVGATGHSSFWGDLNEYGGIQDGQNS